MRGQPPGISQPIPRQQSGCDDIQFLQQHLMYKKLQEFQRQQELGQEQNQHNSINHISAMSKQSTVNQIPALINGMPVSNTPNYPWQNEFAGGDLKAQSNSQMPMIGNMNLAQQSGSPAMCGFSNGPMLSYDPGQASRSMGFVPQQSDQSLYGIPVSNSRNPSTHYSQFQGMSQDFTELMTKRDMNQAQKMSLDSSSHNSVQNTQIMYSNQGGLQHGSLASNRDLHGKRIFSHMDLDGVNRNIGVNLQQINPTERISQGQEFYVQQGQSNWSGNLQEKEAPQPGSSQTSVGLDPTEHKILFSSDDDWASFGRSMNMGDLHGGHLEGKDSFPSIQSGSWSALMQSAVGEASNSNMDIQDEWSGLAFQKMAPSSGNHGTMLNDDNVKQKSAWFHNNVQTVSSLPSHENLVETSSVSHSNIEKKLFSSHDMDRSWNQKQQNKPPITFSSQSSDKGNGWNINGTHSSSIETSFRAPGNESSMHHGHMNDPMKTLHTDRNQSATMWNTDRNQAVVSSSSMVGLEPLKSGNCYLQTGTTAAMNLNTSRHLNESKQQGFYQNEIDFEKHAALDSSMNSQGNENMGNKHQIQSKTPQVWESSVSNSDRVSGEIYDNKKQEYGSQRELSNESYISGHSHPDHSSDSVGGAGDNHLLFGNSSHSFASGSQKSFGQVAKELHTSQRFHYRPKGNLPSGTETKGSQQQPVYSQDLAQMVTRGAKVSDQRYVHQTITSNPMAAETMRVNYSQRNAKVTAEINAKGNVKSQEYTTSASFDESVVPFPQNKQSGQTSKNMLELLHKVDQSREDNYDVVGSGFSEGNTLSQRNETVISDSFTAQPWQHQTSAFNGYGLRLAQPSQRLSGSHNNPSSHSPSGIIQNHNSQNHDSEVSNQKSPWSGSSVPVQSLPLSHQVCNPYDQDGRFIASGQITKEASEANTQMGNNPTGKSNDTLHTRNQLQQQQISGRNGNTIVNHSGNLSFGAQCNLDTYNGASTRQEKKDCHDSAPVTSQPSLPGSSSRVPTFRLSSPHDTHSHVISQSHHASSQGQPMTGDNLYKRNYGQQLNTPDVRQDSQPSLASSIHNLGGMPGTPHNVWTNLSTQHISNNLSQKSLPIPSQSINSGKQETFTQNSQKVGNQDQNDNESKPPNFGAYSSNPQNLVYAKEIPQNVSLKQQVVYRKEDNVVQTTAAFQRQESIPNQASDINHVPLNSSLVRMHQQDREKQGKSAPYSLLQQVQAMKAFETNPSNRSAKRLKVSEIGLDSQQSIGKPPQSPKFHGYNPVVKNSAENELSAVVHHNLFPSDSRMLSFSHEGNEQQNVSKPQVVGSEINQDLDSFKRNDSQIYPRSGVASTLFEQHGNLRNGNIPPVFCASQMNVKMASEQYLAPEVSECLPVDNVVERGNDVNQVKSTWQSASTSMALNEHLSSLQVLPSEVHEPEVKRPKKRKTATSELVPWHKEITLGSNTLQDMRMAERDWIQATNRMIEKVDHVAALSNDGHPLLRILKRLVLTTNLMQLLLPVVPAAFFSEPAITVYENVTYLIAKDGLGNACNLVCFFKNDSCGHSAGEIMMSGKSTDGERSRDQFFLKLLENFVGRARKLEADLNRSEKRAVLHDIRSECQELEKFSIINRFAKFHGRYQADGVESSMASEMSRNMFAQRYVKALPMIGNAPEEVVCLPL